MNIICISCFEKCSYQSVNCKIKNEIVVVKTYLLATGKKFSDCIKNLI